jgi:hypothetical protein
VKTVSIKISFEKSLSSLACISIFNIDEKGQIFNALK